MPARKKKLPNESKEILVKSKTLQKTQEGSDSAKKKPRKKASSPKKTVKKKKEGKLSHIPTQPEVNIGLVGHVDHGKTTLVKALSGRWTDTHSEEIKRGITIRLGYANAMFSIDESPGKRKYVSIETLDKKSPKIKVLRKVSFVDAPGHESLMATMLSGATIMDGAILLIAANEKCPQPQTREHIMALKIIGIKNIVVVQNKVDVVAKEQVLKNYKEIKEFLKGTDYENAPIIPVSAQHGANLDVLIGAIEGNIPTPKRDPSKEPIMFVARSFDTNKPGIVPDKLIGGVLGGSVKQGKFNIGDEIEIKPGHDYEEKNQRVFKSIKTKIVGLMTGSEKIDEAVPGGSVAMLTTLDPSVVKSDRLSGSVVGHPEKLPPVLHELKLQTNLLERVVGSKEDLKVEPIKAKEVLMLNVNSSATVGMVTKADSNHVACKLKLPVCADKGARVTISRKIGNRFRLIGYGILE